jgi:hypothetical protein
MLSLTEGRYSNPSVDLARHRLSVCPRETSFLFGPGACQVIDNFANMCLGEAVSPGDHAEHERKHTGMSNQQQVLVYTGTYVHTRCADVAWSGCDR